MMKKSVKVSTSREPQTTWAWMAIGIIAVLILAGLSYWAGSCKSKAKNPPPVEWVGEPTLVTAKLKDDHPVVIEVVSHSPKVMLLHNFLSDEECAEVIRLGEQNGMPRSTVQGHGNELSMDRTSHTTNLKRGQTDLIKKCLSTLDPRAPHLRKRVEELAAQSDLCKWYSIAAKLESVATEHPFFSLLYRT